MDEPGLAFGIMALGLVLILYGGGQFSKKDGRTKTGYKDNVKPQPAKGCLLTFGGVLLCLRDWRRSLGFFKKNTNSPNGSVAQLVNLKTVKMG